MTFQPPKQAVEQFTSINFGKISKHASFLSGYVNQGWIHLWNS